MIWTQIFRDGCWLFRIMVSMRCLKIIDRDFGYKFKMTCVDINVWKIFLLENLKRSIIGRGMYFVSWTKACDNKLLGSEKVSTETSTDDLTRRRF